MFLNDKFHKQTVNQNKSVLLSEGSSLTSRETIAVLRNSGYEVEFLSSGLFPMSAFSKHTKSIKTVNINQDPIQYVYQLRKILTNKKYDAIIPTHEQAWFYSVLNEDLTKRSKIALSSNEKFNRVQGKIRFAMLLDHLKIPQPKWQIVKDMAPPQISYPLWIKKNYSTAGNGVYKVRNWNEYSQILRKLFPKGNIMAQENKNGTYGQVGAVFNRGHLEGVSISLQTVEGVGGSAAARVSIDNKEVRDYMEIIGRSLTWHGGLTLDFIYSDGKPYFIECNPRMVEPGNAAAAGVNFPNLLINLSEKSCNKNILIGRAGVKTHNTTAVLLGAAQITGKRKDIMHIFLQSLFHKGPFQGSIEVCSIKNEGIFSIVPELVVLLSLLINPSYVKIYVKRAIANYSVKPQAVKKIMELGSDSYIDI